MENVIKLTSAVDLLIEHLKQDNYNLSDGYINDLREIYKGQLKIAYERGAFDYVTSRQNFDNYYKEKYGEQI